MTKKKREKMQITKIRNEGGEIITNLAKIRRIRSEYYVHHQII